jgi:hypothetical protein
MVYLLTSESLNELLQSNQLNMLKKNQKFGTNYYFTPNIGIRLYNAKVIFSDRKNITFQFDKWKNQSLYKMLQYINTILLQKYKKSSNKIPDVNYNLFYETEDHFNIRVYLPFSKSKYNIHVHDNDPEKSSLEFKIPRNGIVYDVIVLEIRNVWEQDTRSGFNIELKSIEYV